MQSIHIASKWPFHYHKMVVFRWWVRGCKKWMYPQIQWGFLWYVLCHPNLSASPHKSPNFLVYRIWKCGKSLRQISLCASFATAAFKCAFRWQQFYPTFKIQFPFVFDTMTGISIFCPKIIRPFFTNE